MVTTSPFDVRPKPKYNDLVSKSNFTTAMRVQRHKWKKSLFVVVIKQNVILVQNSKAFSRFNDYDGRWVLQINGTNEIAFV